MVFKPSGNPESIFLNAADPWTEVDGERANVKTRHFAFSDPAVRKAFGLLVDRKSIQDFVYGRAATATANALNNPVQYNSKAIVAEFNVDKANALLDAAGWKRGADGVRAKDGKRLKLVFQTSINSVRQKVQAIIKQACAKAGIEIELKTVQASVFFSSDATNPDTYGKFFADIEMYLNTRAGTDPDRFMQQWVSWEVCQKSNNWQWQNKCRWSSPEYDKLFRASEQELDPVKRAALFIQMNDMATNAGYVVPVAVRAQVTALAKSISAPLTGWDIDLSGIHDWYRT
jgi:peptide/nickel transport system substrate-binding protein